MISLSYHDKFFNKDEDRLVLGSGWKGMEGDADEISHVLSLGHPICVAKLKIDKIGEENFESSQLVGIDFDKGPDAEYFSAVDQFSKQFSVLTYSTFSSTVEKPRTRVLMALEEPVTNAHAYKEIVVAIMARFKHFGIDPVCKSATQVFFGNSLPDAIFRPKKGIRVPKVLVENLLKVREASTSTKPEEKKKAAEILKEGSTNGSRNNDAVAIVSKYANILPYEDVEAILKLWYDKLPDKEGFPFTSVQTIIKHYDEKSAAVRVAVDKTVTEIISPKKDTVRIEFNRTIVPVHSFIQHSKIEWMIQDWLPVATTAMMVAPPQHFKTWISLAMAMSLGMNKPLFGEFEILKPCNVLVMQQEDSRSITSSRIDSIYEEMTRNKSKPSMADDGLITTGIFSPNLWFYSGDETFRFGDLKAVANLEAYIKHNNFGLVIIDPLYAAATDNSDYMAKDASRMVELKRIRDRTGCSFLVLHHTKKATTPPVSGQPLKANRLDAWGSQFLNAWQETGIQIRSTDDPKSVAVTRYFKASGDNLTGVFAFDISTEDDDPHFRVSNAQAGDKGKIDPLVLLAKTPMTVTQYAKIAGITTSSASRQLARLVGKGVLKRLPNMTYTVNND